MAFSLLVARILMKKIKTLAAAALALAIIMTLTSCPDKPAEKHVAKVVDLRNKLGGQVSFRSTNPNVDFSYELLHSVPRFIGENGVEKDVPSFWSNGNGADSVRYTSADAKFAAIENAVIIEDHPDGIKFTFNRPAGYETAKFTWINIQYLDEVGHKSTGISLSGEQLTDTDEDPKVELIYPLVDPERELTRFWIQISTDGDDVAFENAHYAQLMYKVVPVHGHGCVWAVQPDYQIRDYLGLSEEGVMTLKLTIPPVAKTGTLKHSVGLHMQSGPAPAYSENAGQPSDIWELTFEEPATEEEIEAATEDHEAEFTVDFKAEFEKLNDEEKAAVRAGLKDKPFIWASLIYHYEVNVEGLEGYVFDTPWVISNVVANPFPAE